MKKLLDVFPLILVGIILILLFLAVLSAGDGIREKAPKVEPATIVPIAIVTPIFLQSSSQEELQVMVPYELRLVCGLDLRVIQFEDGSAIFRLLSKAGCPVVQEVTPVVTKTKRERDSVIVVQPTQRPPDPVKTEQPPDDGEKNCKNKNANKDGDPDCDAGGGNNDKSGIGLIDVLLMNIVTFIRNRSVVKSCRKPYEPTGYGCGQSTLEYALVLLFIVILLWAMMALAALPDSCADTLWEAIIFWKDYCEVQMIPTHLWKVIA